jgi:hypothetical protein
MSWRRDSQNPIGKRPHRGIDDPTAENAADPVPERSHIRNDEDLVRRTASSRDYTPRRYEQPVEADDAPRPRPSEEKTTPRTVRQKR